MRPRSGRSDFLPPLLSLLSHGRRVVAVVLVEVTGTLLVGVLLPRGGVRVCDCSKLCLLAIFLVESELALILVVTLGRRTEPPTALKPLVCNKWTFLWLLCRGHEF